VAAVHTDARRSSGLRLSERDLDGMWVLSAAGELDLGAAAQLCATLDAGRAAGHRIVVLDLTGLAFCDSCGLRALREAVDEIVANAGRAVVVPPADGDVARLFELVVAGEFLPLQPTVDDGVAALRRAARR
jgi:anti-sigma B factor antagonist